MKNILILHGWGLRGSVYDPLKKLLENKGFKVFAPDLPGFGEEPLKKEVMTLNDYVDFAQKFIKKNIMEDYAIIGHSFGARVAIVLSSQNPGHLKKLILTGAPGVRRPLPLRSKIAFFLAKIVAGAFTVPPFIFLQGFFRKLLYKFAGEFDYYKAGKLRETFKKIISHELVSYLPKIKIPTLLAWGEQDLVVPASDGRAMQQLMPNAKLIVVKNTNHKLPYFHPEIFIKTILRFLQNDN